MVRPGDPDHPVSIEDPAERRLAAKRFLLTKSVLCREAYAVDLDSIAFVSTSGIAKTALLGVHEDGRLEVVGCVIGWPDPSLLPPSEED